MTTQRPSGYHPIGSVGWGCTLEIWVDQVHDADDPAMEIYPSFYGREVGNRSVSSEWLLIGQIRPPGISLEMTTVEEDITHAGGTWKRFAPGQLAAILACTCIYHPDLVNWNPDIAGPSLLHQYENRESRKFRLSIPVDLDGSAMIWKGYEFNAILQRARLTLPVADLMNVELVMRLDGAITSIGLTPGYGVLTPGNRGDYQPISPSPLPTPSP